MKNIKELISKAVDMAREGELDNVNAKEAFFDYTKEQIIQALLPDIEDKEAKRITVENEAEKDHEADKIARQIGVSVYSYQPWEDSHKCRAIFGVHDCQQFITLGFKERIEGMGDTEKEALDDLVTKFKMLSTPSTSTNEPEEKPDDYEQITKEIIRSYGKEAYYKKLEEFFKLAESLRMEISISPELDMPIYAKLRFEPLLVWREKQDLIENLQFMDGKK